MSGKRQRQFQIDQKTLQYKEKPKEEKQQDDISQRKIFKIKSPLSTQKKSDQSKKVDFSFTNNGFKNPTAKPQGFEKSKQQKPDIKFQLKTPQQLFASNGESSSGFGIFQMPKSETNDKNKTTPLNSLFSKNSTSSSIFNNSNGGSLFSSSKDSIFNFSNNGIPPVKKGQSGFGSVFAKDNDGSDEENSQQLQKQQANEIDPSKSSGKYQYSQDLQTLYSEKALKYKKDGGDLIQNIDITIQKDKQSKVNWIFVRLSATQNKIFTGVLVKGKSQIKTFGKAQNISLTAAQVKKQIQKHVLKFQFDHKEKAEKLMKVFKQLV